MRLCRNGAILFFICIVFVALVPITSCKPNEYPHQNLETKAESRENPIKDYAETITIEELKDFGINVEHLVINNVIAEPDCEFHRKRSEMQKRYIREISGVLPATKIPMFPDEIKGVGKLKKIKKFLFG